MKSIIVFILFLAIYFITPDISSNSDVCSTSVDTIYQKTKYFECQVKLADSLYKNYLPQHNFDEVKKAMDFFESEVRNNELRTNGKKAKDKQNLIYNCARANYYHAVGLTELDDIIGACEHYLRALELMEEEIYIIEKQIQDFSKLSSSEYDKIKFIILTYTRLGNLFYNENYCDLAIVKYNKALIYSELIKDTFAQSHIFKVLGNTYQLYGNNDSALYYYNKSIKTDFNPINRLDVEKSIATILYANGEKDSAYSILRNNLDKMENYGAKDSYYIILGNMYYQDKEYDSAINYLNICFESKIFSTKISSAMILSAVYDSIGNHNQKAFYDNSISQLFIKDNNRKIKSSKLQYVYDNYKEINHEREKLNNKKSYIYSTIAISIVIIIILTIISIFRNKQKNIRFSNLLKDKENIIKQISKEIHQKEEHIKSLEFKHSLTEGKIKSKNTKLQNQEETIKNYQLEIFELKKQLEKNISCISNLNGYYQSEICSTILRQVEKLSEKNIDTSRLNALKQEEFVLLLKSANIFLNDIFNNMANRYPKLKKEDLYYLCLAIINLNDKQISSLFGVSYNSIKIRKRKICSIFDIRTDEINTFLSNKL